MLAQARKILACAATGRAGLLLPRPRWLPASPVATMSSSSLPPGFVSPKSGGSDFEGEDAWATLPELLDFAAPRYADRPLFGTKDSEHHDFSPSGAFGWTSYADFQTMVARTEAALAAPDGTGLGRGMEKGERVAIVSNNRLEFAVMAYACFRLGLPVVPLYEQQISEDWDYIIRDCGASLVCASTPAIRDRLCDIPGLIPPEEQQAAASSSSSSSSSSTSSPSSAVRDLVVFEGSPVDRGTLAFWQKRGEQALASGIGGSAATAAAVLEEDLAVLIYTSGTTGKPKGVMLSHGNVCSNIKALRRVSGDRLDEEAVTLSFLPWAHIYGQTMELHSIISAGGSMGIAESPHTLLDDIQHVKPTLLVAVPTVYNRIYDAVRAKLEAGKSAGGMGAVKAKLFQYGMQVARERRHYFDKGKQGPFDRLVPGTPWLWLRWQVVQAAVFSSVTGLLGGRIRFGFTGGAALSPIVQQWYADMGIPILEGYGLTETSPVVVSERYGPTELTQGGLRPVPGVNVFICQVSEEEEQDGEGGGGKKEAALTAVTVDNPGDEGEICVVGPNVMQGYWGRPDATAEALVPLQLPGGQGVATAFRTGDLGRMGSDDVLTITGRANEQYKLENGKFVLPGGVEDTFRLWSPYVQQAFVWGLNRPHNVMVVVPDFVAVATKLGLPDAEGMTAQGPALDDDEKRRHEALIT